MHHKCVYKYSSTRAILMPSERVISTHVACVVKTCQNFGEGRNTRDAADRVWGASHICES